MLKYLVNKAFNSNVKKLNIDASLNAVNFYANNGFKETGRSQYQTQSGNLMSSVQMVCDLTTYQA